MKDLEKAIDEILNNQNATKESKEGAKKIKEDICKTRKRLTEEIRLL